MSAKIVLSRRRCRADHATRLVLLERATPATAAPDLEPSAPDRVDQWTKVLT
jgi:hypothetical protein